VNLVFPAFENPNNKMQTSLMSLAALFLFLNCAVLTLAPAVRYHGWNGTVRWEQWIGLVVWLVGFSILYRGINRYLPDCDPYLLPIVSLLSGWGLITIFRLDTALGFRQTLWLALSLTGVRIGIRSQRLLPLLRRYKYVWLTLALVLTLLTLFFGTYPGGSGIGPGLWLDVLGIYLQPSEFLKLALIIFLAAYLADAMPAHFSVLQLLAPTLVVAGASIAILVAQRDLGTALIFIVLYTVIVYIASGRRRVLFLSLLVVLLALIGGYNLFDVIRLRIEAWLNPWLDPAGRSYQIVQSLMSLANGELFGRGLGLGSPGVVPVAQSDFIYSSIVEESGLLGAVGLLLLLAILTIRGFEIALHARNQFHRFLSIGITSSYIVQAVLIIGGNIRLFPLTGITLPFVSYGGSSLVVSFFSMLLLFLISDQAEDQPAALERRQPYTLIGGIFLVALMVAALMTGWWSIIRSSSLLSRSDNPRRAISDTYVQRGKIVDRNNLTISQSTGAVGSFKRTIELPALSATVGYSNPDYGQTGIEYSMDGYLRGVTGNTATTVWENRLLYGQYPPGLDIRLSIDSSLQNKADALLVGHKGAIVLLNASTGEVLVSASAPTFDANALDTQWQTWMKDKNAPLLNRVTQGQYPAGSAVSVFLYASSLSTGLPAVPTITQAGARLCASAPENNSDYASLVASGCPAAVETLAAAIPPTVLWNQFTGLGLFSKPDIKIEGADASSLKNPIEASELIDNPSTWRVSPLQLARAAAAISNAGQVPSPVLVTAYKDPTHEWVLLPNLPRSSQLTQFAASKAADRLSTTSFPGWETLAKVKDNTQTVYWYMAGTNSLWKATPLSLVVLLENASSDEAKRLGEEMLLSAVKPYQN
jgi:cell division protein FtsW (lipid II flippase)